MVIIAAEQLHHGLVWQLHWCWLGKGGEKEGAFSTHKGNSKCHNSVKSGAVVSTVVSKHVDSEFKPAGSLRCCCVEFISSCECALVFSHCPKRCSLYQVATPICQWLSISLWQCINELLPSAGIGFRIWLNSDQDISDATVIWKADPDFKTKLQFLFRSCQAATICAAVVYLMCI